MTILTAGPSWQDRAALKRSTSAEALPRSVILLDPPSAEVLDVMAVPAQCGLMTGRELEITESRTVGGLLEKIARREYTSLEVAAAFIKRAVIAQQLVSLVHSHLRNVHGGSEQVILAT
jgi:amidase